MSQQLIPTFTGELAGETQPLVNARDLHAVLGVGKDFSNWIKDRIESYGFIEGEEFSPVLAKTSGLFGGRPKTEYHITLDMAKELAMLENNDKGRQTRRFFVQMEKLARQEIPAYLRRGDLPLPGQAEALRVELFIARPLWAKLSRYHELGLSTSEMGRLVGKTADAVRHHLIRMSAAGLIAYAPPPQQAAAGRKGRAAQLGLEGM